MNIGFYGHSSCAYRGKESFLDIVSDHFNFQIVNQGAKQGSEERILFELKKTKRLDIAVIFHSLAKYVFVPESDRDLNSNSFHVDRANQLLKENKVEDNFTDQYNPKFKNLFQNDNNLVDSMKNYRKYFYHPDLIMNRFQGALTLIDQYLFEQQIFSIHVIDEKKNNIPKWFEFRSGVVDYKIMEIINDNKSAEFNYNLITNDGNKLVAQEIINIIAVRGREVLRLRETQETEVRIPQPLQTGG